MEPAPSKCCSNKISSSRGVGGASGSASFLSTLLIILIPKCPLCMTAYMSALAMFLDLDNEQLMPILHHAKPVMGMVILLLILLNRRGRRTLIALGIGVAAMAILLLKTYYNIRLLPDWLLYVLFIFAIWYNGNFQYFYRFIRLRTRRQGI